MSSTPPPSTRVNPGTMMPPNPALWLARAAEKALLPEQAYALARTMHVETPPMKEAGYRLYWLGRRVLGVVDLHDAPDGFAVVGRHSSCDIVLLDELAVSLRHVLVRATALDDGFPVLRVLDLHTREGFQLADGSWQRSIVATGPVVFRVGVHSLVALPSTGELPAALPPVVVDAREVAPRRAEAELRLLSFSEAPRASRITLMPKSVELSSRPTIMPRETSSGTGEGYELILEGRGLRTGVELSAQDLERGVLIGQSDKCVDQRLRLVFPAHVSRVHVLLLREADRTVLYDVASLNGTYQDRQRIRSTELFDAGTVVTLAARDPVRLTYRGR